MYSTGALSCVFCVFVGTPFTKSTPPCDHGLHLMMRQAPIAIPLMP